MRALFTSKNLIGDALYISAPLRAWIKEHPGWDIYIETLNDHVLPLYEVMARDLAPVAVNPIGADDDFRDTPEYEGAYTWDFKHTFDVNEAFQVSHKKQQHLAQSYADLLGVDIGKDVGPFFTPDLGAIGKWMDGPHQTIGSLKDCILISTFSASCTSREGKRGNKMLPWEKWKSILQALRTRYPDTLIRFLGAPTDMIPHGYAEDIVRPGEYMLGIPLHRLAWIMKGAKMLVTVDNGMAHLAASQKCPTYLFYPKCLGLHYILPIGNPNLVHVHMDPIQVSPAQLVHVLQYACDKFDKLK